MFVYVYFRRYYRDQMSFKAIPSFVGPVVVPVKSKPTKVPLVSRPAMLHRRSMNANPRDMVGG